MTHVLVVDDDADTRAVLREMLEESGYAVTEAPNAQVALGILRTSPSPLVVILDALMPGGNGTLLLQAVCDETRLACRHAYLLLTAMPLGRLTLSEDIQCLLAAPVIRKPFELDAFLAVVAQAATRLQPGM